MYRISWYAAILPAFALAACGDSNPANVVAGVEGKDVALVRGEQVARDYCAQCHGADFQGALKDSLLCPALNRVKEYSFKQFDQLLLNGVTIDGDRVTPMTATQPLSLADRIALHEYLISLKEPQ
jgi:hypothetical protein